MAEVFGSEAEAHRMSGRSVAWFWVRSSAVSLWCAAAEHLASLAESWRHSAQSERLAARRHRFEGMKSQLISDVRDAIMHVERRPGRSTLIVSLAAGVAAFTTIALGVAHGGLWGDHFPGGKRLVSIETAFPGMGYESFPLSPVEFAVISNEARSYQALGAWASGTRTVSVAGLTTRERIVWASPGLFELLQVDLPVLPDTTLPRPAYVSWEFWQSRFGADDAAVGSVFDVNGLPTVLAGVMPRELQFWLDGVSLWIPFVPRMVRSVDASHMLNAVGLLAGGVTREEAGAELAELAGRWRVAHQGWHGPAADHPLKLRPFRDTLIGTRAAPLRMLLVSGTALLFLSLAHLASAGMRRAGRRAVSSIIEHSLLVAAGSALGVSLGLMGLVTWAALGLSPVSAGFIDSPASALLLVMVGLAIVVATIVTTIWSLPVDRFRGLLIAVDVAAALALLVGAGLLARTTANLTAVDTGFDAEGLVAYETALPIDGSAEEAEAMIEELLAFGASLPGVSGVAITSSLPISPELLPSDVYLDELDDNGRANVAARAYIHYVSPGYADVMGMRFIAGRAISGGAEAVVSRSLAERLWPGRDPVGLSLIPAHARVENTRAVVVGVVADVVQSNLVDAVAPQLYVSREVLPADAVVTRRGFTVVMRTDLPDAVASAMPLQLELGGRLIPISRPARLDARTRARINQLILLLELLAGGAVLCLALGIMIARSAFPAAAIARPSRGRGAVRVLGRRLGLGLAGGAVLAFLVKESLDPLLFQTSLADPSLLAWVVGAAACWLALVFGLPRSSGTV